MFYVTEIVLSLGFADAIFRRERSDDRKCVCCSQATSLEFEFHFQFPCSSPSTELSDFRQSMRSGNEHECKQTKNTCAKGNDAIINVISANQHFASTFSMQIFKFQRRSCMLSFLFPSRCQSAQKSLLTG